MNIASVITYMYPNANPSFDFIVQDDGEGQYIAQWNLPEPRPTQAEMEDAWIEVHRKQKINILKNDIAPKIAFKNAPDFKQRNVGMGIYDTTTSANIKNWVIAVRSAVDEIEVPLIAAQSIAEIDAIILQLDSFLARVEAIYATL